MAIAGLRDLLEEELQDLYSAEEQIIAAIPKMIDEATSDKLIAALSQHLEQTETQLTRLDSIATQMGIEKQSMSCKGIQGIIEEGKLSIEDIQDSDTKDAAIIAAAQKVEHYEMAGYGSAKAHAKDLGLKEVEDLLEETLKEEKEADKLLSAVAEGGLITTGINEKAADTIDETSAL